MNIELEDTAILKAWLEEFNRPENQEKITLPNCIYSFYELRREILRRDFLEGVMEDLGKCSHPNGEVVGEYLYCPDCDDYL